MHRRVPARGAKLVPESVGVPCDATKQVEVSSESTPMHLDLLVR